MSTSMIFEIVLHIFDLTDIVFANKLACTAVYKGPNAMSSNNHLVSW